MVEITSHEDLEEWLEDKLVDWAQVIAARAALRALPYAFATGFPQKWVRDYALSVIRALAISWAARNIPAHDMEAAAASAARAAAASAARAAASAARTPDTARAASAASADASAAVAAAYAAAYAVAASAADAAAADVAATAAAYATAAAVWANVSHDCNWLERQSDAADAARRLTQEALWPAGVVADLSAAWEQAANRLRSRDQGYDVWIDWYERRIEGRDAAFDIPGDEDRTEDKAILIRLADATDEDFWGKGATHVNTTLQSWIDEARERAALPDFAIFSARISAGSQSDFSTNEAINRRADLERKIAALNDELSGLEPAPAPIGHNRPPLDLDGADIEDIPVIVQEIRTESASLGDEIKVPQSDLQEIVAKLSRLRAIGGWLAKKADMFADEAVKKAGAIFGGSAALFFAAQLPQIQTLLLSVLNSANEWLQAVLPTL